MRTMSRVSAPRSLRLAKSASSAVLHSGCEHVASRQSDRGVLYEAQDMHAVLQGAMHQLRQDIYPQGASYPRRFRLGRTAISFVVPRRGSRMPPHPRLDGKRAAGEMRRGRRRGLDLQQVLPERDGDGLCSVGRANLLEYGADMLVHAVLPDAELSCDITVGESAYH